MPDSRVAEGERGQGKPFVRLPVPLVGVVGGIGSGKSHVARLLAEKGGTMPVDADKIGHFALRQPAIRDQVIAQIGDGSPGGGLVGPDGEIDRKKVATLVFGNPGQLKTLEKLTHPWIRQETVAALLAEAARPGARWVVLDASLLLESGWRNSVDRVVFVDAPDEVRLARVLRRPGWTPEMWKSREKSQLPLTDKRRMSDDEINNSSDLDGHDNQLLCIVRVLESLGSKPAN